MINRYLLLVLAGCLIFTGGFYSGFLFSSSQSMYKDDQKPSNVKKIGLAPKSKKQPELKAKSKLKLPSPSSNVLIGYVQDYRKLDSVNYSKLTYVNFSFAHPTKDGGLLLNGKMAWDNLRAMVAAAHQHGTKIMLSVGGWYHIQGGESYQYFKPAITNPISRTKLVNALFSIADQEKLDGIDIDFEHPRSKADAQNLSAFIRELSIKLHSNHKELSIAVQAKINGDTLTESNYVIYQPEMFQYVDHVNIMAYDGQWDGKYNAANLSPYPFAEKIVNYWTNFFKANNLPLSKLVLGVPCYAQPESAKDKQVSYAAIVNNNPVNASKDIVSMNGKTYYYNGETTIQRKTNLALDHGFGGMMLWEEGQDSLGPHSLTNAIVKVFTSRETAQKQVAKSK